jgi:hypothetical protein
VQKRYVVIRKVVLLARILIQVEQLLTPALGPPNIFRMTIGQGLESLFFAVANSVFEMQPLADLLLPTSKNRHKAPDIHLRTFSAHQFQFYCGSCIKQCKGTL